MEEFLPKDASLFEIIIYFLGVILSIFLLIFFVFTTLIYLPASLMHYAFGLSPFYENLLRLRYKLFRPTFTQKIEQCLSKYQPYYKELSQKNQLEFIMRTWVFIQSRNWIPRIIKSIPDEVKILVASSAVQLTFGFRRITFEHFRTILLYPDAYYSKIRNTFHKGEVKYKDGKILLSINNFLEGYKDYEDGINLGIHEMAHAMQLEFTEIIDYRKFSKNFPEWEDHAGVKLRKVRKGKNNLLRDYAGTSLIELFAVSLEVFFEKPDEFAEMEPDLFNATKKLLRQDPRNKENPRIT